MHIQEKEIENRGRIKEQMVNAAAADIERTRMRTSEKKRETKIKVPAAEFPLHLTRTSPAAASCLIPYPYPTCVPLFCCLAPTDSPNAHTATTGH
jgi:hypothetical protein